MCMEAIYIGRNKPYYISIHSFRDITLWSICDHFAVLNSESTTHIRENFTSELRAVITYNLDRGPVMKNVFMYNTIRYRCSRGFFQRNDFAPF